MIYAIAFTAAHIDPRLERIKCRRNRRFQDEIQIDEFWDVIKFIINTSLCDYRW
jgi:hypothetical protein